MRVLLKFVLDCPPDAAWRALRSPAVLREVSAPLIALESLDDAGFPTIWEPGTHRVRVRALGAVPIGTQTLKLQFIERADGVRMLRDSGGPDDGMIGAVSGFVHRMAISPDPAGTGKTLYRDELRIRAGALTPAVWAAFWVYWQTRGQRLRQLAHSWHDEQPPTS